MAFRFFRRVRLAPGLTLNLSKRSGSLSFGPRGAKVTAGTSGVRRTVSLPGTRALVHGEGRRRPARRGQAEARAEPLRQRRTAAYGDSPATGSADARLLPSAGDTEG